MEKTRSLLYLTMLVRALRRIAEASEQDDTLSEFENMIKPTELQYLPLIKEAEALSLGDMQYPDKGYHIPRNTKIQSLLEQIKTNKDSTEYCQPTVPITLNDLCFPTKEHVGEGSIKELWNKVKSNVDNLQHSNIIVLSENILNILFRFAVLVPSSERCPDVSLYDQARVAAAIAICLYDLQEEEGIAKEGEFILIGGDFSGIQKYIYQIVSKYAGKNLKGRSFYLSLLSDAVVRTLLSKLSLYRANIVYNSGGCFYLLAPNTSKVKETLDRVIKDIEDSIFKVHGTQLYVAIDKIPLTKSEIVNNKGERTLSEIWQALFCHRDSKKSSRYANAIQEDYERFFCPQEVDGLKRDVITGEDFIKKEKAVSFVNGTFISETNDAQIKLGKALVSADVLVVSDKPLDYLKGKAHICPAQLGNYYYLSCIRDIENNIDVVNKEDTCLTLVFLNGYDFKTDYVLEKYMTYNICSLQFYGGNQFNGKTYEEMCDNDNFSRLGILRMDVDNLGSIFQSGIQEKKASLTRFAALSRSFDYFFSGYLNEICQENGHEGSSFIVYSGGDDVFIVGSWEVTIEIAKQIQTDFRRYTCFNPAFSISGGIAILGTKYPVIAGAHESEEEEEKAKNHLCDGQQKNSISFLSTPLNWQKEFPAVEKLKDDIVSLLNLGELPKSFLSKIMEHSLNAGYRCHKVTNFRIYWHLAYDIKRMKERCKSLLTQELLDKCINEICHSNGKLCGRGITTDYNILELWAFACRWAELEYRTKNN